MQFGKHIKNIFAILICVYLLILSAYVIRIFAESLVIIYFPNIDLEIVILIFIAITVLLNLLGFKAISRTTSMILPVILVAMIIIFVSSASEFVPERALPILGYGANETFISGINNIFAFSSVFILGLIAPFINEGNKLKKVRPYFACNLCFLSIAWHYCTIIFNSFYY